MALGREVDDRVEPLGHQAHDQGPVRDIPLHEPIARLAVQAREIVRVSGIRQSVEVNNLQLGVGLELPPHEVRR